MYETVGTLSDCQIYYKYPQLNLIDLGLNQIFRLLALNPAKIIKTNLGSLDEGRPADIIIFDPDKPVKINRFKFQSISKITPFVGFNLQGENLLTVVKGEIFFQNNSFKV